MHSVVKNGVAHIRRWPPSAGVERLPIAVINCVDAATLTDFFEEYTAAATHPTAAAESAPAACCRGPLAGGVCGCAADHAPTHSYWAELALFSRGGGGGGGSLDAQPGQREIETELERQVLRVQKGKGCCKVDAELQQVVGDCGDGRERQSLRVTLSIECRLGQSAVGAVLRGFLSSPVADKNGDNEGGELRQLHNTEQLLNYRYMQCTRHSLSLARARARCPLRARLLVPVR